MLIRKDPGFSADLDLDFKNLDPKPSVLFASSDKKGPTEIDTHLYK